ncbi:MAG: zinc-ribbon domain-containing protein [Candidatus Puniceispirillaceae bacterium]
MLLTCPQCETIFRVDRLRLHPAGQPVHCRICDHIWTVR